MYYVMGLLEFCFGYLKVGFEVLHKKVLFRLSFLSSEGIERILVAAWLFLSSF
jgi:hypothetical protein